MPSFLSPELLIESPTSNLPSFLTTDCLRDLQISELATIEEALFCDDDKNDDKNNGEHNDNNSEVASKLLTMEELIRKLPPRSKAQAKVSFKKVREEKTEDQIFKPRPDQMLIDWLKDGE